jgi:hypothetical protein
MAHQMIRRRPQTQLVEFPDAGHWITTTTRPVALKQSAASSRHFQLGRVEAHAMGG